MYFLQCITKAFEHSQFDLRHTSQQASRLDFLINQFKDTRSKSHSWHLTNLDYLSICQELCNILSRSERRWVTVPRLVVHPEVMPCPAPWWWSPGTQALHMSSCAELTRLCWINSHFFAFSCKPNAPPSDRILMTSLATSFLVPPRVMSSM